MSDAYWDRWWRRRYSRRTFVATGATTAVGAAALLAGCGDDDDDDNGTIPTPDPDEEAARYGGTFVTSSLDPYRGLDPAINTLVPVVHSPKAYSWTHRFQVSEQKVIHDMATAFETPDGTTINYTIRGDIKFQNVAPMDGRVLTAEDCAYSWKRFEEVGQFGSSLNASGWTFLDLGNTDATDATNVSVKLQSPTADALAAMGQHFYAVVAREAVEANGGQLTTVNAAGAGPYILDPSSDISRALVWNRNPDYFSHDHTDGTWFPKNGPYIDTFELRTIADATTAQAQILAGDMDSLYYNVLNVDRVLAQEFRNNSNLNVLEGKVNEHVGLGTVLTRLGDTRLRQALQKAIDYDGYIDTIHLGDGRIGAPVGGGFPDTVRLPEEEVREFLKHDPADAKALWEAASGPSSLTIITIAGFPFMEQAVGYVKQNIEQALGITVNIDSYDVPSWIAKVTTPEKDFDLYVFFDQSLPDLPSTNALANYNAAGSSIVTTLFDPASPNPEVADLADQMLVLYADQASALTPEDRTPKIHAMQRFALEHAVPSIPLPVKTTQWVVVNKRVKNVDLMLDDLTFWNNNLTNNVYLDPR